MKFEGTDFLKAGCLTERISKKKKGYIIKRVDSNKSVPISNETCTTVTSVDSIEVAKLHLKARYGTYYRKTDLLIGLVQILLRDQLDIMKVEKLFFQKLIDNGFEMVVASTDLWPKHWNEIDNRLAFSNEDNEEIFEKIYWSILSVIYYQFFSLSIFGRCQNELNSSNELFMKENSEGKDASIRILHKILLELQNLKPIDLLSSEVRTKKDGKKRNLRKMYEDTEFWRKTTSNESFVEKVYEMGYKGILFIENVKKLFRSCLHI